MAGWCLRDRWQPESPKHRIFDTQRRSDGELVARARALLGEAHRVANELLLRHPDETRLINNLTTYSATLSAMFPKA